MICHLRASSIQQTLAKSRTAIQTAWLLILLTQRVIHPFYPTALRRCHAQTGKDSSLWNEMDYFQMVKISLNPEGHQNCITVSEVKVILLDGGICLLIDFHREGSAPVACGAGLFCQNMFFYWQSFIGKDLRVQPAEQACFVKTSFSCSAVK